MTAHADLAEVRAALALVAQATPGPWRTFGRWPHLAVVSGSDRPRIVASLSSASDDVDDTPRDAAAIVALRNAAAAIAAAVEELEDARAEIASAREQLDRLRSAVDERDGDMHMRIRAGYDKTVADAWRAVVAQRDAEIAALNRQVCRLVSGHEIEGDRLCQHHGADAAALAQVARYQAAAVAVAAEIGGSLGPVDDDPEERAAAFVRFAESLPGRVRERVEALEADLGRALHRERRARIDLGEGLLPPDIIDMSCPVEGCGGQVEGGEFVDGSTSRCTRCGEDVVCTEAVDGTFRWEIEEDDDADEA